MYSRARLASATLLLSFAAATPALEDSQLRDPTRPPTMHQDNLRRLELTKPQSFVVTAIKIGADGRKALVNQKLLAEGDRIGEATIVEIAPGEVVIDYLSQRQRIRLLPYDVRRAPKNRKPEE